MNLIEILKYLGITPSQLTPVIIVGLTLAYFMWRCFLRDIKEEVTDLHHATKEIQKHLEEEGGGSWSPQHSLGPKPVYAVYGQTSSPTTPNEAGKKLLSDSGFNSQYLLLRKELFTLMDTMNLRTLYDYETGSLKALEQLKNHPAVDPLKDYAVNNPSQPLELIFKVASWVIRDDYDNYKKAKTE